MDLQNEIISIGAVIAMIAEMRWAIARLNKRLDRLEDGHGALKTKVNKFLPKGSGTAALYLVGAVTLLLALSGCSFDIRQAAEGGASGAAAGFQSAGPMGAIVGGIVAAIAGGFAVKNRRGKIRRDRIIDYYRRNHGNLPPGVLEAIKRGQLQNE